MVKDKPLTRDVIARLINKIQIQEHTGTAISWNEAMKNASICYGRPIGFDTRRIYLNAANKFWGFLNIDYSNLYDSVVQAIENCGAEQYSTRKHIKESGISLAKYLISKGGINDSTLSKLQKIQIKRSKEPNRPVFKPKDLETVLNINLNMNTSESSKVLNEIVLKTAFYTGLRVSELINLKIEHVYLDEDRILVLHGKHGKNRWIGINRELKPDLKKYIKIDRPQTIEPYLFVLPSGTKLSRDRIEKRLKLLTKKAGLAGGCHQLRRGCLTHYANKGVPVPHLQLIAGHSNIETTMKYIRPDVEEVIRNQVNYSRK
jgi:integrase